MNRILPSRFSRLLAAAAIAAVASLAALPFSGFAADAPQKKKEEPKLPVPSPSSADWKVEVVKEKPDVQVPSVVAVAPDGRVFYAEDPMDQVGPGNQPIDRILCLHPDGHTTVFADHLYAVFGIAYLDGKLHVHHSPKYTVFTDDVANGTGKDPVDYYNTDNPATWGGGSLNDHIPAQMHFAMDGYMYMSTGDKGIFGLVSNIDKSSVELYGGGVIRFRPDGTKFEVYATGTRNSLDISINAEDEIFSYDNTDDGIGWNTRFTHLVDGGFYGYPHDYRPEESDAEGMAKWKALKDDISKAKGDYEKAVKEATKDAKTDEEKAAIVAKLNLTKPSALVPPFRPYTLWAIDDFGGGSPCGAIGYNEDALPPEYRGNLFHSEWGKGAFERFVVERAGATYRIAKRDEKFLKGGSQPFRPLGVDITTDGMGFYICDWNFNGWNSKKAYDAGRLLKLTYTGKSMATAKPSWYVPAAMGQKFTATTADLIAALSHPARSVRLVASRRTGERGAEAVPGLIALLNDNGAAKEGRWHAIWTLDRIEGGKAGRAAILATLANPQIDVSVRMQAARELGTRQVKEAVPALLAALNDSDAAMRFRAATALGRIGDVNAVQPLIDHLTEKDFFAHYAVFRALNRIGTADPSAWDKMVAAFSSDKPEIRAGLSYAMRNAFNESLISGLSAYVANAANPLPGRVAALETLAPLAKEPKPWSGKWWGTQPQRQGPPPREVDWAGTANAQGAIRTALNDSSAQIRAAAIAGLQIVPDPATSDTLVKLFATEKDPATRHNILKSLTVAKAPSAAPLVLDLLKNIKENAALLPDALALASAIGGPQMLDAVGALLNDASPDVAVAAADSLGKMKDAKAVPALSKGVENTDPKVAAAAVTALGQINGDATLKLLTATLADKRPDVRKAAATALGTLKNKKAIPALLPLIHDKEINKEAILALANMSDVKSLDAYLAGLETNDGTVRNKSRDAIRNVRKDALPLIEARLDSNPPSTSAIKELQDIYAKDYPNDADRTGKLWKFDTKKLSPEAFATFARNHAGEARKGQNVFKNQNVGCIKCHKVGNDGADVGPNLTGIGTKYDKQFLIESVLYPSKQILDGYQQTILRMKDGDVISGVVKGETAKDITLFDGGGNKQVVDKSDVKEREHGKLSLMPEGLQLTLKPEEFADLIAYLESLKEGPKK
jgi:putative membrane-bound dehydrogenase-like protein